MGNCLSFSSVATYFQRERLQPDTIHAVLSFIFPLLIALLGLKYIGKPSTPYETHPKTMLLAIGSLLGYCLTYGAQLRVKSPIFSRFMELFGCLTVASLASILFPDTARWVLFASCAIFWTADCSYRLLRMVCDRMQKTVEANRLHSLPQAQEGVVP